MRVDHPQAPLGPWPTAEILSVDGQHVKADEPQTLSRRRITAQDRVTDRREILPEGERNQRAFDRYLRARKTPWPLGRDYERYRLPARA